jgi:hypothetical protein
MDWFLEYGLSIEAAVEKMQRMGVDFVSMYNVYMPGVNTAVPSLITDTQKQRLAVYTDEKFRDKLGEAGIAYLGYLNFNFFEEGFKQYGNYAVDQHGEKAGKIDWYIGGCPTSEDFIADRLAVVERGMQQLHMDGVHMGFTRYPGFWELWLPGTDPASWHEYCFCDRCIHLFETQYGEIPYKTANEKRQYLRTVAREQWNTFKCNNIYNIITRFRDLVKSYNDDAVIMLNTVPFDAAHYGNAGREFFGQDITLLSDVVDYFEVMCYNQILAQDTGWITDAGNYFKSRARDPAKVLCTVQGGALYTQGMHAGKGRAEVITPDDFRRAMDAVHASTRASGADGLAIFTWSDMLRMEQESLR